MGLEEPKTLTIDVGGTGIKMMTLDHNGVPMGERARELTPDPATPDSVFEVFRKMLPAQEPFDRVSVGFPGVVERGVVRTAPNLGTEPWAGYGLQAALHDLTGRPVRALNDADLQGYGVIRCRGLEMALTLGTGLGSALYSDGHLVPNLELGHHPLKKGETYEDRVRDTELERIGKKKWRKRVLEALETIQPIFNPSHIYIGGGNAKKLDPEDLPAGCSIFRNEDGLTGGLRLWEDRLGWDD